MRLSILFPGILFGIVMETGCTYGPPPSTENFSEVECRLKDTSGYFSSLIRNVAVDTADHQLRIRLEFCVSPDFPFPVIDSTHDTLSSTALLFRFFSEGRPILLDHAVIFPSANESGNRFYGWGEEIDSTLCFASDTFSFRNIHRWEVMIPLYAFQKVKAGKRNLDVRISQTYFCSDQEKCKIFWNEELNDTIRSYYKNYAVRPMISGTASFRILVPPIRMTVLYGEGLQLRNDSVFSPLGMDNTIWNLSYPDIYWTVFSPNDMFYCKTPFEKTTDRYEGKDTFRLYHYNLNDSIRIGVYDHDWLSRDDWMGSWDGKLEELYSSSTKELKFDNIEWFRIRAENKGMINR